MSADVEELLSKLDLHSIIVVGHSMGGSVALRMAPRVKTRVQKLVLVDYAPEGDEVASDHILVELKKAYRSYRSIAEYQAYLTSRHPLADPGVLASMALDAVCEGRNGFSPKHDFAVLMQEDDHRVLDSGGRDTPGQLWGTLSQVGCPLLIIRGIASSVVSPAIARRISQVAPRSTRFVVVPMAGHSVHIENPVYFSEVLMQFAEPTQCPGAADLDDQ